MSPPNAMDVRPIISHSITVVTGATYTGLAYEYLNAGGYGSGDWLMLDRQAGWVLYPHYRIVKVVPETEVSDA